MVPLKAKLIQHNYGFPWPHLAFLKYSNFRVLIGFWLVWYFFFLKKKSATDLPPICKAAHLSKFPAKCEAFQTLCMAVV